MAINGRHVLEKNICIKNRTVCRKCKYSLGLTLFVILGSRSYIINITKENLTTVDMIGLDGQNTVAKVQHDADQNASGCKYNNIIII